MILEVDCPSCGRTLRIDHKYSGTYGNCNHCRNRLLVPAPLILASIHLIITGKLPSKCEIIELAGIQFHPSSGTILSTFSEVVRPDKSVPRHILNKTCISEETLENARPIRKVIVDFLNWASSSKCIGTFDAVLHKRFLQTNLKNCDGASYPIPFVDLESWVAAEVDCPSDFSLESIGEYCGKPLSKPANAISCAETSMVLFQKLITSSEDVESAVMDHYVKNIPLEAPAWRNDLASMSQLDYLKSLGLDIYSLPNDLTKGEASDLIEQMSDGETPTIRR